MILRPALAADAAALGALHVRAWRETYPGIVPDAILAALDPAERAAMWAGVIADGAAAVILACDADGVPQGFACAGVQREPAVLPQSGEFHAIYLLRAAQGRGMGRALMRAAARALVARGMLSASLWVLDGNDAAFGFYAALGGRVALRRAFPPPQEWDGRETAFAWDDLRPLAG